MTETITPGRKWGTVAIACLAMLLIALDMTVLHLAVPKLTEALEPTATQFLWIVDIYGFLLAGSSSRWATSATGSAARSCC